ncbi:MAG: helix-turn-helix transcriptional regulator [Lachnospiraceae bacterium]|nr:helix-turn-helix transcriptional regulator [Lachnospiraceae bacterium]
MHYLFEKSDSLNAPVECFIFDASQGNFPIRPHWHYFAEFIYMLRGSCEMNLNDRTCIVNEGEFAAFPPSSVHSIFSVREIPPVYAVIKFDMMKFPGIASYSPSPSNVFQFAYEKNMPFQFNADISKNMDCHSVFLNCIKEIQEKNYGFDAILRSQIYRLIYQMIRYWINCGLNLNDCKISAENTHGIENIMEYIDSRLDEPLKVNELAAICHMSYSGFAAKFHERYGMSCKEYMEKMRIFKAEEYLLFTDFDLNYISQNIGFSDCSHFIRTFKKLKGVTPKQFRQKKSITPAGL